MKAGTLALSWGKWGGFYVSLNGRDAITRRVCFGWLAFTWVGIEIDNLMEAYADAPAGSLPGDAPTQPPAKEAA